eukprot:356275-Chlamydomonas_euryale.AAC.3
MWPGLPSCGHCFQADRGTRRLKAVCDLSHIFPHRLTPLCSSTPAGALCPFNRANLRDAQQSYGATQPRFTDGRRSARRRGNSLSTVAFGIERVIFRHPSGPAKLKPAWAQEALGKQLRVRSQQQQGRLAGKKQSPQSGSTSTGSTGSSSSSSSGRGWPKHFEQHTAGSV